MEKRTWAIALLLVVSVLVFRIGSASLPGAEWLAGFAPLAALVLGMAMLRPHAVVAVAAVAAFLVSDLILNGMHGAALVHPYLLLNAGFYGLLFLAGRPLAKRLGKSAPYLLATVGGVVAFHIAGNTVAWLSSPGYATTLGGWIQSNTTGLPGFPPAWLFLLKSLVGNLAFAGLFLIALRRTSPAAVPAATLKSAARA